MNLKNNFVKKFLKYSLLLIIGLLVGFIIHGLIEIPALWLLRTRFIGLLAQIPWPTWLMIHLIFTIIIEILGIVIIYFFYNSARKKSEH